MARILGIDVGARRVGVAVSDPEEILATGVEVIDTRRRGAIDAVSRLAERFGARVAVIGLPLRADGSEGESARQVRRFGDLLGERTGLEVRYADERFTTVDAHDALREVGVKGPKRRGVVDRLAAQIILQRYLDGRAAG
jgi:putative Holliday junction resolvase